MKKMILSLIIAGVIPTLIIASDFCPDSAAKRDMESACKSGSALYSQMTKTLKDRHEIAAVLHHADESTETRAFTVDKGQLATGNVITPAVVIRPECYTAILELVGFGTSLTDIEYVVTVSTEESNLGKRYRLSVEPSGWELKPIESSKK